MGKASKKVAKQQAKTKSAAAKKQMTGLEQVMKQQMQEEKYEDAINTMAELAKIKCMDPGVMYDGAMCYFMLGDYERAANWINNTLTYEPNHPQARILLARLCILQDRTEDGLAIFDFVAEHYLPVLSAEEIEDMEDILEYYARNEADKLCASYPHLASFLKLDGGAGAAAAAAQPVREVSAASEAPATAEEDPLAKARAAIASMKQLMNEAKAVPASVEPVPAPAAAAEPQATEDASAWTPAESADVVKADILDKHISMVEKIALFNSFASAYYYKGDAASAVILLDAALEIDDCHVETLRNRVCAAIRLGKKDEAMEYLAKMPLPDFVLLDKILG